MVQIIGLFPGGKAPSQKDWSNQDLAEFYRVEAALLQAGLQMETERGLSDEGDPWFVFCRREEGDTIIHFARIDGRYVVAAPILPHVLVGSDLREIIQKFVAENPVSLPISEVTRRDNVLFHPAALLTIFVATVLVMSLPGESIASAMEKDDGDDAGDMAMHMSPPTKSLSGAEEEDSPRIGEKSLLLAAVAVAVEMAWQQSLSSGDSETDSIGVNALKVRQHDSETSAKKANLLEVSEAYLLSGHAIDEELILKFEVEIPLPEGFVVEADVRWAENYQIDLALDVQPQLQEDTPAPAVIEQETEAGFVKQNVMVAAPAWTSELIISPEQANGDALRWLEKQAEAEGLNLVFLDEDKAPQLPDIMDKGALVGAPDEQVLKDSKANVQAPFDEAARKAVLYFMSSDDDIVIAGNDHGLIVIFDQSDLASSEPLTFRSWAFDDTTIISILGHSDTIADAMALVA